MCAYMCIHIVFVHCPLCVHVHVCTHAAACQTPSEDSRCSSSMGYLEPRPSHQPQGTEGDHLQPSPKDIQKHLMEKVAHLNSNHAEKEEKEEEEEEEEEGGVAREVELEASPTISSSHSSQSLNSSGSVNSKGISFGSIFKK